MPVTPTTLAFLHVPTLVGFCILYLSSMAMRSAFLRFSPTYRDFSFEHQRTCVICPWQSIDARLTDQTSKASSGRASSSCCS